MIFRPRSYAAHMPKRRDPHVIADASSRARWNCLDTTGRPRGLQEACPRHAPNQYAMLDARHVLEGARA